MNNVKAVVLAAGKGTRLQTAGVEIPKVMRLAAGRPLLRYVCDALDFIPKKDIVLVVGFMREQVIEAFPEYGFAVQAEQLGTGHAVACAMEQLRDYEGDVLVCCGDMPLLRRETYLALAELHRAEGNACTLLSGTSDEPLPYGRVVRGADGRFAAIVEEKDCTPEQRAIRELNSGVYLFRAPALRETLGKLRTDNAQGEYYLTDVPAFLLASGEKVGVCCRELGNELLGVNTPQQLEAVGKLLAERN